MYDVFSKPAVAPVPVRTHAAKELAKEWAHVRKLNGQSARVSLNVRKQLIGTCLTIKVSKCLQMLIPQFHVGVLFCQTFPQQHVGSIPTLSSNINTLT